MGVRRDPVYGTMKFHEGMDFSAPVGTPVYATADGLVRTSSWQGAYGNMVEIDHGFNYVTRYAHLSKLIAIPGQQVTRGDLIGLVGIPASLPVRISTTKYDIEVRLKTLLTTISTTSPPSNTTKS